ncbi:DNA repair protein RAD23, putative [Plasmodium reichenowi]|uniref:UV excision repair protein RAD23 n=1 Tax=Plasmodium reichenowi TaxID=5854 RepID=A0A2P9DF85_PLARE|nr:DNA repair protein RAD23, putative [Plasmodium reichenowi]
MKIKVRTLQNNEEEINVDPDDSILDLKKKVEVVLRDMPSDKQKLIFSGKILKDEDKATDILKDNDIVIVMVTRRIISKNNQKEDINKESLSKIENNNNNNNNNKSDDNINVTISNTEEQKENKENKNDNTSDNIYNSFNNAESMLLTGDKLKESIDNICAMGFEKEQVKKAMILAYNNPNRAIDYLTNGFPNENINVNVNENINNGSNFSNLLNSENNPLLEENSSHPLSSNEETFRNSTFFNAIRDMALSNPQRLPELLQMIGRTDPSFLEYIRQNQTEFLAALQNYGNNINDHEEHSDDNTNNHFDDNLDNADDENAIQNDSFLQDVGQQVLSDPNNENINIPITPLNENEMESIKKLESLGFPKHVALEAFIACDKNEEMAANYLFENMNDFTSE